MGASSSKQRVEKKETDVETKTDNNDCGEDGSGSEKEGKNKNKGKKPAVNDIYEKGFILFTS